MAVEQRLGPRMRDESIDQLVSRRLPDDGRCERRRQQALGSNPPNRFVGDRFLTPNRHRLGDARVDVARLYQRHQPRLAPFGPVRWKIDDANARVLKLADERFVVRERREKDDLAVGLRVEQTLHEARAENVAGGAAVRHRHEHDRPDPGAVEGAALSGVESLGAHARSAAGAAAPRCTNSYVTDTRPSSSSPVGARPSTPRPCPLTAKRGPAVTTSYDASRWRSVIDSRRTYCRGRSGSRGKRHSMTPSPITGGTLDRVDFAVVTTSPVSTSMMAISKTGRSIGWSAR